MNYRLVVLSLGIAAFLMLLMPATQLWDWDEPLYARTAVEMLGRHDFILPTFNGAVFPDKPPLAYWLMALSVSLFGPNEFAVRLPSGIEMALAVWMTGRIGVRLFSPRAGMIAALILATSLLPVYIGAAAMVDAGLLAAICLGFLALVPILQGRGGGWNVLLFWLALLLSMLAKGPVGPAVLCTGAAVAIVSSRKGERPTKGQVWGLVLATLFALAGFLLWAVPANMQSGGEMLQKGIGLNVISRALSPMQGHGAKGLTGRLMELPYYLPVIVLGLFPWTLLLPDAIARLWRGGVGDRTARVFLWAWILPALVMFSLAATKLPHYILPVFPALALAIAANEGERPGRGTGKVAAWFGILLQLLVSLLFALLLFLGPKHLPVYASPFVYIPLAVAVFLPLLLAAPALLRPRPLPFAALATLAAAIYLACWWLLLPAAEPGIKLSRDIGTALAKAATPETQVYMGGYAEPSLVFYAHLPAGQVIHALPAGKAALEKILASPAPLLVVATAPVKARIEALSPGHPFRVLAERSAINTNAGGRLQHVFLLARPAATAP